MEVSDVAVFLLGVIAATIGMGWAMAHYKRGFQKQLEARSELHEESSAMFRKNIEHQVAENGKYRKALDQVIRSSPNSIAYRLESRWDDNDDYYDISLFVDDLISKKKDEEINAKTEDRDSRLAGLFNKKNGGTK